MEAQLDANGGDGDDGGLACYLVGRSSRQAGHCDPVQLAATTGTPEFGAMAAEGIGASAHDTSKEWQRDLESWLPCFGHLVCHKFHLEFLAQPPIRLRTHSSLHQSSLLKESKSGPLYMMENPVKIVIPHTLVGSFAWRNDEEFDVFMTTHEIYRFFLTSKASVSKLRALITGKLNILKGMQHGPVLSELFASNFAGSNANVSLQERHHDPSTRLFQRLQFPSLHWRISDANVERQICPTYPKRFIVPIAHEDSNLNDIAFFRSEGRLPLIRYYCKESKAILARSGQPMYGSRNRRCMQDEQMIKLMSLHHDQPGSSSKLCIVDLRTKANAALSRQKHGGGTEIEGPSYGHPKILYTNIESVEEIAGYYHRLLEAIRSSDTSASTFLKESSDYMKQIQSCLRPAVFIAKIIAKDGISALIHCDNGNEITSVVASLVKLLADPWYRTFQGFLDLIEEEWCETGFPFFDPAHSWWRLGKESDRKRGIHVQAAKHDPSFGSGVDEGVSGGSNSGTSDKGGPSERRSSGGIGFGANIKNFSAGLAKNIRTNTSNAMQQFLKGSSGSGHHSPSHYQHASHHVTSGLHHLGRKGQLNETIDTHDGHYCASKVSGGPGHAPVLPVFILFLDAVHQIYRQFPSAFAFTPSLLFHLFEHVQSGQYGSFLFTMEPDGMKARTTSYFDHLQATSAFLNPIYRPDAWHVLQPKAGSMFLHYWREFYEPWCRTVPTRPSWPRIQEIPNAVSEPGEAEEAELVALGAVVTPVSPFRPALPSDAGALDGYSMDTMTLFLKDMTLSNET